MPVLILAHGVKNVEVHHPPAVDLDSGNLLQLGNLVTSERRIVGIVLEDKSQALNILGIKLELVNGKTVADVVNLKEVRGFPCLA